ncbi:hypothetical protein BDZ89DRAFT_1233076 [Hymenopellis radicata]|nr:hypothetical protein BDZ89DRAFT_1233076 [Hymenopellis radicata]
MDEDIGKIERERTIREGHKPAVTLHNQPDGPGQNSNNHQDGNVAGDTTQEDMRLMIHSRRSTTMHIRMYDFPPFTIYILRRIAFIPLYNSPAASQCLETGGSSYRGASPPSGLGDHACSYGTADFWAIAVAAAAYSRRPFFQSPSLLAIRRGDIGLCHGSSTLPLTIFSLWNARNGLALHEQDADTTCMQRVAQNVAGFTRAPGRRLEDTMSGIRRRGTENYLLSNSVPM